MCNSGFSFTEKHVHLIFYVKQQKNKHFDKEPCYYQRLQWYDVITV